MPIAAKSTINIQYNNVIADGLVTSQEVDQLLAGANIQYTSIDSCSRKTKFGVLRMEKLKMKTADTLEARALLSALPGVESVSGGAPLPLALPGLLDANGIGWTTTPLANGRVVQCHAVPILGVSGVRLGYFAAGGYVDGGDDVLGLGYTRLTLTHSALGGQPAPIPAGELILRPGKNATAVGNVVTVSSELAFPVVASVVALNDATSYYLDEFGVAYNALPDGFHGALVSYDEAYANGAV